MKYNKEPKDGKVTPNSEITWDGKLYYVNDETYSDYLIVTDDFAKAVIAFEEYGKYL